MPSTLKIFPLAGRLTRDTENVGSMDPYCKITIGTRQERSRVHADGGKFPQWNDEFDFTIVAEDIIKFEVWDRNHVSSDSIVGEG
jgi:Ca2+-dependent lipid-binding protein